jgi:hypothetical protein
MILLLHTILADQTTHDSTTAAYIAGQTEYRWTAPTSQPYHVLDAIADRTLAPPTAQGSIRLPTDQPGLYALRAGQSPDQPALAYSVNVAESESDPARIDPTSVQSRFRAGLAWVWPGSARGGPGVSGGSSGGVQVGSRGVQGTTGADWGDSKTPLATRKITIPLTLFLLGLLIAESLFSNRIYNRNHNPKSPAEPRF